VAPVRVADESTTRRMLERMRSLKNWLGQDGK